MKTYDELLDLTENAMTAHQLLVAQSFPPAPITAVASPFPRGVVTEVPMAPRRFTLPAYLVELYESRRDASPHRFSDPAL